MRTIGKCGLAACLVLLLTGSVFVAGTLRIYFIDVEGGESTLIITPVGESLLIDAGYSGRENRDPDRIMAAVHDAGLERIDYLLITHFHPDHAGGVPELASRIPIGTYIDYGQPLGTPYGADRMTTRTFATYETIRGQGRHLEAEVGLRLPLKGLEADVVSAGGTVLQTPLPGAGQENAGCAFVEDHAIDGTENYRSIGVLYRLGAFRFLDLGDLSGNTLATLACPRNILGKVDVYLVAHHGDYDTNFPALYAALRPRVAIMNNGVTKGGSSDALKTLRGLPDLEDLWQLHDSQNPGSRNAPEPFVANTTGADGSADAATSDGYWIKLVASDDGSFSIVNGRNGFSKHYSATR